MDKKTKKFFSLQIEVFLQKFPQSSTADIKDFSLVGSQADMILKDMSPETLLMFILYQRPTPSEDGPQEQVVKYYLVSLSFKFHEDTYTNSRT